MRLIRGVLVLLGALLLVPSMPSQAQGASGFKVGLTMRRFVPEEPYDWRGAKTHALVTMVWYPADAAAVEAPQWVPPSFFPIFNAGTAARGARLAPSPARFPLILLSHGTGGSAPSMAWFATALASRGYIVAGVNHPGNNALEAYTPRGFLVWWERARDLSVVLDRLLADPTFADRIDAKRVGAAGFSLGGYTMIEIAGGVTDLSALAEFCASKRADPLICEGKGVPEFPNLVAKRDELARSDPAFQAARRRAGASFRDLRVRAVFAMAPALGPVFRPQTLEKIPIPVEIVAGTKDEEVPVGSSAKYYASHIPGAKLTLFPGAGHYVFLDLCALSGRLFERRLCADPSGVDREDVHTRTANLALAFFAQSLR